MKYASAECKDNCILDYFFEACGPSKKSYIFKKCSDDFGSTFFPGGYDKYCLPACPLECQNEKFDYQLGFLNFPVQSYFEQAKFRNLINRSEDFSILKQSVLKLTLRYDELSYTHIVQEPKTLIEDLIASIGGTMGKYHSIVLNGILYKD